ncbi:hypothetical protein [Clostridium sp. WB02_MRS01]|uniref:hypothetical protein n=1 Tax=Clostridia TaxID=186801 RepID=UPI00256FC475|nr:hypothetical protein [Clostridium sp. WB02_MRS01]
MDLKEEISCGYPFTSGKAGQALRRKHWRERGDTFRIFRDAWKEWAGKMQDDGKTGIKKRIHDWNLCRCCLQGSGGHAVNRV